MNRIDMFRRVVRNEKGQSILEFALALPVLLIIVLGIIDFGMMFYYCLSVTNAAREGARIASEGKDNTIITAAIDLAAPGLKLTQAPSSISVISGTDSGNKQYKTISIKYRFKFITGINHVFDLFAGKKFGEYVDLNKTATMIVQ